jgi:hypothetical protein
MKYSPKAYKSGQFDHGAKEFVVIKIQLELRNSLPSISINIRQEAIRNAFRKKWFSLNQVISNLR